MELKATIDAAEVQLGEWTVVWSITANGQSYLASAEGLDYEEAYWRIGNKVQACKALGIPARLTETAEAVRRWWDTDRFVLVYMRYGQEMTEEVPTLDKAWKSMESLEDSGEGSSREIRTIDGRALYRHVGACRWERVDESAPPLPTDNGYVQA